MTSRPILLLGAAAIGLGACTQPGYQTDPNQNPRGRTGAILGGLAIGVAETMGAAYISVPYKDAFGFVMLLAVLLVRPQGLFGERIAEKA